MATLWGRIFRWRAACPYCGSRFARLEFFRSGRRRCGACDAMLKPAEPANWLGNLAFGVPLGLALVVVMTYVTIHGAPTRREKLAVAAAVAVILFIQHVVATWAWPYITPFAPIVRQCWNCKMELVHRYANCPRCGAQPNPLPKLRAARVIPCGSVGSPATSDSA